MKDENFPAMLDRVKKEISKLTGHECMALVGFANDGTGMTVTLEMVEKKSIPESQDILGIYEVKIDAEGNIKEFMRMSVRRRSDAI